MSAELLRAQAAAKELLADRIQHEAATLPTMLDGVAARFGPDVWRGPAAEDFGLQLRRWQRRLDDEGNTLLVVARRLRQTADELRSQAATVEAAERAAQRAAERAAEQVRARTAGV